MNTSVMRITRTFSCRKNLITFFLLFVCFTGISGNEAEWKSKTDISRNSSVEYCLSTRIDENGKEVPLVEYRAIRTAEVNLQNCVNLLLDIGRHSDVFGVTSAELIDKPSDSEWIVRHFTDAPFPLDDYDFVGLMSYSSRNPGKEADVMIEAAPQLAKKSEVKRSSYSFTYIQFRQSEKGELEILIEAKMSPPVKVPLWMIKMGVAEGALGMLDRIVTLAETSS